MNKMESFVSYLPFVMKIAYWICFFCVILTPIGMFVHHLIPKKQWIYIACGPAYIALSIHIALNFENINILYMFIAMVLIRPYIMNWFYIYLFEAKTTFENKKSFWYLHLGKVCFGKVNDDRITLQTNNKRIQHKILKKTQKEYTFEIPKNKKTSVVDELINVYYSIFPPKWDR